MKSFNGPISAISLIPQTTFCIATCATDSEIHLHDITSSSVTTFLRNWRSAYPIDCIAVAQDSDFFVAGSKDSLCYFDMVKRKEAFYHRTNDQSLDVTILNNQLSAAVGTGHHLNIFDLRQREQRKAVFSVNLGADNLNCIKENNNMVYVGSSDGAVYTVDLRNEVVVMEKITKSSVNSVDVIENNAVVSASNGIVSLYDTIDQPINQLINGQLIDNEPTNDQPTKTSTLTLKSLVNTDNSGNYKLNSTFMGPYYIANGTDNGTVEIRNAKNLNIYKTLQARSRVMTSVIYDEVENRLLCGSGDGEIHSWESVV